MFNKIKNINADIDALASKDVNSAAVMLWNYHDDDKSGPAENVNLTIENIPAKKVVLNIYLIDKENSNSYEVWEKMGSPQNPTKEQITILEKAGQLEKVTVMKNQLVKQGKLKITTTLAQQAVVLVKADW